MENEVIEERKEGKLKKISMKAEGAAWRAQQPYTEGKKTILGLPKRKSGKGPVKGKKIPEWRRGSWAPGVRGVTTQGLKDRAESQSQDKNTTEWD